ncbi:DUF3365 domain-containing protein [Denitrobacterium detoxificans]|jgi:DNA-binding winged helix-turn-helix (wHTH) protein/HAMP domain-containing protein|uniref:c-type heme family protein n=1 Tax=Denitrobacterium detoxificans TaxID=79604 RepID=UPI0026F2C8FF|nr:DUF3365 domain-containing protein [Denitrobacterium detoxificans]MBE6465627.1 DUF3365 domain-containing protein [Denitrobacterium detoxificans]
MSRSWSRGKGFGVQGRLILHLAIVVVVLSSAGMAIAFQQSRSQAYDSATEKATALADQMEAVWDYVETHQDAISADASQGSSSSGYICIISVKSVAANFSDVSTSSIRYTSLRPRNVLDEPDSFEREAMEQFKANPLLTSYGAIDSSTGDELYRYMRPVRIDQSCLSCHGGPEGERDALGYAKEGYAIGDLAGALSISESMDVYYGESEGQFASWLVISFACLIVAVVAMFAIVKKVVLKPVSAMSKATKRFSEGETSYRVEVPRRNDEVASLARDFNGMADEIEDLYSGLEKRVEERTVELERINATLSDALAAEREDKTRALERLKAEREEMSRRVFEPFSVGDFVFDRAKYAVSKRGQAVPLTPKEFSIVFALASRAGEVVSQQELVREAWGEEYSVEMVGLAVYVRRIRKKIEDDPAHPTVILTIWGEGYTFAVHD